MLIIPPSITIIQSDDENVNVNARKKTLGSRLLSSRIS